MMPIEFVYRNKGYPRDVYDCVMNNVMKPIHKFNHVFSDSKIMKDTGGFIPSWVTPTLEKCAQITGLDVRKLLVYITDTPNIGEVNNLLKFINLDYATMIQPYIMSPLMEDRCIERLKFVMLHELRHVDQHENRYLYIDTDEFDTFWMGMSLTKLNETVKRSDDHFLLPHEIDANAYALSKVNIDLLEGFSVYDRMVATMKKHNLEFIMAYED